MNFERYERESRRTYAALAATVAGVLEAAINAETGYRLHHIAHRAKQPASLRKKLEDRHILDTQDVEGQIKDLAGCRIIFYTNGDFTRFINSDLIPRNFDVQEVKVHHPLHTADESAELYISNHYIVRLGQDRLNLPEYSEFGGMRCEIQVKTILNHAWAEMEHDIIYKGPKLTTFGGREFQAIRIRLQTVARKYLLPAGHEFQKIASDFERLIEGKELFDGKPLAAIVDAADNNLRLEALEKFSSSVLPYYDNLQAEFPGIVSELVAAFEKARATLPRPVETPYGMLPAKTSDDILAGVCRVLHRYLYQDIALTFDALRKLYAGVSIGATSAPEREQLQKLARSLAEHNRDAWLQVGPSVQIILLECMERLSNDELKLLSPLLSGMLELMLGTEVSGATSTSSTTITFYRGVVTPSDQLRKLRTGAIQMLMRLFELTTDDKVRHAVLWGLHAATSGPLGPGDDKALILMIIEDTSTVVKYLTQAAACLTNDLLQKTEYWIYKRYSNLAALHQNVVEDPAIAGARDQAMAAAIAFQREVNLNPDYVIYKTLVGFEVVLSPAWDQGRMNHEEARAYRAERVNTLVASIDLSEAEAWLERLGRYARTEIPKSGRVIVGR